MNKKLKFIIAGVAIVAGLASAVSCKDYSSDIAGLTDQVNSLSSKVSALENEIKAGAVITSVKTFNDGNGGIEIVLSNGQSYKIYNGTNGKDGAAGTSATVWEIKDGYWYKDGVKTEYKAVGTDGKNGTDGTNGTNGTNGTDGKNGNYWEYEEGYLVEYDGTTNQPTGKKAEIIPGGGGATGGVTAVWDSVKNTLTIKGVKDEKGLEKDIVLNLVAQLESLVFIPELYIDGVEGFTFKNFQFMPQDLTNKDKKAEKQVNKVGAKVVNVNPATYVYYHVNPANAKIDENTPLRFVVDEKEYKQTRAAASKDFDAKAEFCEFKEGVLKVKVTITGTPATAEMISILALEVTREDGTTVTSDYATTMKEDLDALVIALPNAKITDPNVLNLAATATDAHYRRATEGISTADAKAWITAYPAWTDGDSVIANVEESCDLSVKFDSSIDLANYVAAHKVDDTGADVTSPELTPSAFAALGLSWEFAVVMNYAIGTPVTPQDKFVTLEGSVFTPRVYSTTGEAAIGRTPIIRVALKHGTEVIQYAYIKVFISDKEKDPEKPFDAEYKFDGKVKYDCNDKELNTTVEYMNVKIYNELGMSKDAFHALYNKIELDFKPAAEGASFVNDGTVSENTNPEVEGTHTLKWIITKDEIWAKGGKDAVHYVKYYNDANPNLFAVVKLVASIDDIKKAYNITKAEYISNYWDEEKTATRYNVAVPLLVGDTDPDNCVFFNDINASFVTWPAGSTEGVPGVLKLDKSVTKIQYYFCNTHKITDLKVDGKAVTFTIKADGLELWGNLPGKAQELIATIVNDETAAIPNSIELNKASDLAKSLLNVNKSYLYVYLGAKGIVCNDDTKVVTITFDGKDHFRADYVRPVDITDVSKGKFIDAVDYGEKGSYISIEDLVAPKDWRGRNFVGEYITYWDFYGPFDVTVDLTKVECDLNGVRQALPVTVELKQVTTAEMQTISGDTTLNSKYGYITYKNNGTGVSAFNIFLKEVKVSYGWGVIIPDKPITVPVASTIED